MQHINLKFLSTISILLFCCIGQIFAQSSLAFDLPSSSYSQSHYWQGTDWRAERAFNRSSWNAGDYNTHWIQVDLGKSNEIHTITFSTGQSPSGVTWHEVYISDYPIEHSWNHLPTVASRFGWSTAFQPLELTFPSKSGRYVQIVANSGPSWTDLGNVRINPDTGPGPVWIEEKNNGLEIHWIDNSDDELAFTVLRKHENGNWSAILNFPGGDQNDAKFEILDRNVKQGGNYSCKIETRKQEKQIFARGSYQIRGNFLLTSRSLLIIHMRRKAGMAGVTGLERIMWQLITETTENLKMPGLLYVVLG